MDDFDQWRTSVINQTAFMLVDSSDLTLAAQYFERHNQANQAAWTRGEDALSVAIQIVNAEQDHAEILEEEREEQSRRDLADTYFELESELIEHWRQDCLDNGLI